jgi:hypothetical protein
VADSLLEPGERAFLAALDELGVPYLIVGVGAAVMQGAPLVTQGIDLWFEIIASKRVAGRPKDLAVLPALEATLAVHDDDR